MAVLFLLSFIQQSGQRFLCPAVLRHVFSAERADGIDCIILPIIIITGEKRCVHRIAVKAFQKYILNAE